MSRLEIATRRVDLAVLVRRGELWRRVDPDGESLDPSGRLPQRPQCRREHGGHGVIVSERRFLGEHHQVVRAGDVAVTVGGARQGAGQGPEQGGLGGPILADKTDPAPGRCDEVEIGEDAAAAERDGEAAGS